MRTRVTALLDNIPHPFERSRADKNIYREKENTRDSEWGGREKGREWLRGKEWQKSRDRQKGRER